MGNSLGRKKSAKVMKISGETFKLKTPVLAGSVLASHPGHVLLESEAVKHYGVRAKPLEPQQELQPKRLYFLVELPKFPEEKQQGARRVRSGIQMSAKDRLESLMLARRSASDLCIMKPPSMAVEEENRVSGNNNGEGSAVRVRMRVPKAEVERLMAESKDGAEVAEKIVGLCMAANGGSVAATPPPPAGAAELRKDDGELLQVKRQRIVKPRERRVGFLPTTMPISEGEIHQLVVAS